MGSNQEKNRCRQSRDTLPGKLWELTKDVNVSIFFRSNDSIFFCTPQKNLSFIFLFKWLKMLSKKTNLLFSKIIEIQFFLYFCFGFYLFLWKVWTNWNFSFRNWFISKSKLYSLQFFVWALKKRFVLFSWIKYCFHL